MNRFTMHRRFTVDEIKILIEAVCETEAYSSPRHCRPYEVIVEKLCDELNEAEDVQEKELQR